MLVTFHTALPKPSPNMRAVTTKIVELASTIVVLTNNSKNIIETLYPVSQGKVFVIPHGIHPSILSDPKKFKAKLELKNRIVLTTFGLLSRGKGIEYALQALPEVIKIHPTVMYLILGETHPVIQRNEGEKYRLELAKLVTKLGLKKHVRFYDQYFALPDLLEVLKATDIYVATPINPNQAVSGTLSYALGTGLAVVSTAFSQAKEIVTPETGRLVPIKDSPALTNALLDLLSDENRLKQMHINAYTMTRPMLWSNVSEKYTKLLTRLVIPEINLKHLHTMTDEFGLFQFSSLNVPNKAFGYTIDDNARALILCSWLIKQRPTKELETLIRIYLTFIKKCQVPDGSFINYIDFTDKLPSTQNNNEDLEDAQQRTMWALSEIIANTILAEDIRLLAKRMFLLHLQKQTPLTHLRSQAFAIKSLALVLHALPDKKEQFLTMITHYADALMRALTTATANDWHWFENKLNYANALLSESLLIAGEVLQKDPYTKSGLSSLTFLISKTFSDTYIPIGHSHWYENKQKRSQYDQQPEDPAAMILALAKAYTLTTDQHYKKLAGICFSWFLGNNTLKKPLYDKKSGGCYDGLHPDRVNLNQGAESLVSYLMASVMIRQLT